MRAEYHFAERVGLEAGSYASLDLGMIEQQTPETARKKLAGITALGVTTPLVQKVSETARLNHLRSVFEPSLSAFWAARLLRGAVYDGQAAARDNRLRIQQILDTLPRAA